MSRTNRNRSRDSGQLPSITPSALATVTGGRLIPSKQMDAQVLRGLEQLIATLGQVGEVLAAGKQANSQQTMQLMQQLMERRRG